MDQRWKLVRLHALWKRIVTSFEENGQRSEIEKDPAD